MTLALVPLACAAPAPPAHPRTAAAAAPPPHPAPPHPGPPGLHTTATTPPTLTAPLPAAPPAPAAPTRPALTASPPPRTGAGAPASRATRPPAPTAPASPTPPPSGTPTASPSSSSAAAPRPTGASADALRSRAARSCRQLSSGLFRRDAARPPDVPVCAGVGGALHWTADLDIDCDGRPGPVCHAGSGPYFQETTAWNGSDGRPLSADEVPYVVVPGPSARWSPAAAGVTGGTLAVLVHGERVRYAVVGDTGPVDVIGEASYAAALSLGLGGAPQAAGTQGDVLYLLFPDTRVRPVEDPAAARAAGRDRVARYLRETSP
ncbi:glycoside hydrolase family 75 protein [Streptomyces sp. CA-253872]|uniref:glycoside hydrolase family 75 protein n=1 Tax=Streptomyces sp. CA-253872 TaxID=3240067 RepID=UPI003D89B2C6